MGKLPRIARIYILGAIGITLALFFLKAPSPLAWQGDAGLFIFVVVGAATAQFFTVVTPKHQHYYLTPAFFFAAVLTMDYCPFALVVALAHIPEWIKVRYPWYIQTFNIASHALAGFAARAILLFIMGGTNNLLTMPGAFAVLAAASAYILLNHLLVGIVLLVARNVSLRESQVFKAGNVLTDLALACVGASIAFLWSVEPWLVVLGTAPLVLIHRALSVPTLREEANVDAKTSLYNVKYFGEVMADELRRARRFARPLAVIMADLDGLRHVNNTYGHLAGDAVLIVVARIIREQVREYDLPCRFGGEEFAILMPETTTHEGYVVAERIRKAIETTPIQIPSREDPVYITVSAGVASFPADGHEAEQLIHAADVALYQGKAAGKNRVRMSVPGSNDEMPPTPPPATGADDSAPLPPPVAQRESGAPLGVFRPPAQPPVVSAPAEHPPRFSAPMRVYLGAFLVLAALLMTLYLPSIGKFGAEGLVILAAFAAAAELLSVDLYGASTVSVSFVAIFAAAIMFGPVGAVTLGPVIALAHWIRRRPRVFQVAFNAANHVVSSTVAALVFMAFGVPLHLENLLLLSVPVLLAATVNYFLSTLFLAVAMGLSEHAPMVRVWKEHFRWLVAHYLVMGVLALFFALAYQAFDVWGVVAFMAPLLIMRYAQKQYVDQTVQNVTALRKVNEELAHANEEIQMINDELLTMLANAIDARDPYVYGHSARVAEYAVAIARELNLPPERVELLRRAALLHDVGKIGLPEGVLNKNGALTAEEFEVMKQHAVAADGILGVCHNLQSLVPIVRSHHERWDGMGYPAGLRGDEIPLESRILMLADAVEAMASDRTYHRAKVVEEILAEVEGTAGSQFDPKAAAAFARVVRQEGPGFIHNSAQEVTARGQSSHRHDLGWMTGELQTKPS